MSDGPHTSLNMHRSWKKLAKYADNKAHSLDDVATAYLPALAQTCDIEAPPQLMRALAAILSKPQPDFFQDQRAAAITALRLEFAGFPLANAIFDAADKCVARGEHGAGAAVRAVAEGLLARAASANRSVEEHYYRESTVPRSKQVRDRLESALNKAALTDLARHRLNMDGAAKPPRVSRQSGLDDGVTL